jgi:YVTN family beta-propeller protein
VLKVGSDPEEFALNRDGSRLIVANEDTGTATIWDIATGQRVSSTLVSEEPEGVTLHPTRDEVYVACEEEGDVYILDSNTGAAVTHVRLGGRPRTITFSPDGARAYVPLEAGGRVVVLDAIRHEVLDGPSAVRFHGPRKFGDGSRPGFPRRPRNDCRGDATMGHRAEP